MYNRYNSVDWSYGCVNKSVDGFLFPNFNSLQNLDLTEISILFLKVKVQIKYFLMVFYSIAYFTCDIK